MKMIFNGLTSFMLAVVLLFTVAVFSSGCNGWLPFGGDRDANVRVAVNVGVAELLAQDVYTDTEILDFINDLREYSDKNASARAEQIVDYARERWILMNSPLVSDNSPEALFLIVEDEIQNRIEDGVVDAERVVYLHQVLDWAEQAARSFGTGG